SNFHIYCQLTSLSGLECFIDYQCCRVLFVYRRLWEQVTRNLKHGDIDAATDAKCRLEQRQRDLARHRQENKLTWVPECFRGEGGNWIYRAPLVQRFGSDASAGNILSDTEFHSTFVTGLVYGLGNLFGFWRAQPTNDLIIVHYKGLYIRNVSTLSLPCTIGLFIWIDQNLSTFH
ncbi:hypothetical protein AHF37_07240, partial [Paragonimus kellicotti]